MLDNRARILLKTLVERYISEGQPVGSRALSKYSGLDLSPATVRNVMADLEEQGFIASPHTSAGRIPTPRGYRLFVDSLLAVQPLAERQIHAIEGQLAQHQPQRLISSASQLLSELTQFAGVVQAPRRQAPAIRQIEFLSLSEKRILLIIVTTDGDVQNRILLTEKPYSPAELVTAAYRRSFFGTSARGTGRVGIASVRAGYLVSFDGLLPPRAGAPQALALLIVAWPAEGRRWKWQLKTRSR